jgi:hypothetical protein
MSVQLALYKTRSPPKRCTSFAIFHFCSVSPSSSFPPLNRLSPSCPCLLFRLSVMFALEDAGKIEPSILLNLIDGQPSIARDGGFLSQPFSFSLSRWWSHVNAGSAQREELAP